MEHYKEILIAVSKTFLLSFNKDTEEYYKKILIAVKIKISLWNFK